MGRETYPRKQLCTAFRRLATDHKARPPADNEDDGRNQPPPPMDGPSYPILSSQKKKKKQRNKQTTPCFLQHLRNTSISEIHMYIHPEKKEAAAVLLGVSIETNVGVGRSWQIMHAAAANARLVNTLLTTAVLLWTCMEHVVPGVTLHSNLSHKVNNGCQPVASQGGSKSSGGKFCLASCCCSTGIGWLWAYIHYTNGTLVPQKSQRGHHERKTGRGGGSQI